MATPAIEPLQGQDIVGFWGQPTATLDWCEKNYVVSYYIAEFWNTITNLWFIVPAIYGIIDSYKQGFETRYIACYALLLLTGVGSWLFHMTLLYPMQLLDELPMIWGAVVMLYGLYRSRNTFASGGKNAGIALAFYASIVTAMYLLNKNPIFHQVMCGIIIVTNVLLALRYNDLQYHRVANALFLGGLFMCCLGFMLWNIDNQACSHLTYFREVTLSNGNIGSLISPLTQLHGWWHAAMGYAGYINILNCIRHHLHYLGIEYSINMSWIGPRVHVNMNQKAKLPL